MTADPLRFRETPLWAQGRAAHWTIAAIFAAFSALIYALGTRLGIGILPDSTAYMNMGTRPYDAPLYSWLLQTVTMTGLDIAEAAKVVGLALVGLNSALLWHLLASATRRPAYAAVGTAIILLSPTFVALHAMAMSEPLFTTFMLLSFLAVLRFWETGKVDWLYGCGVLVGLLSLVRFTAPPFGAAIAVTLLCDRSRRVHRRTHHAVIVGAVAGIIFLTWIIASDLLIGRSTGRPLRLYGNMDASDWYSSFTTVLAWVAPSSIPIVIRVAMLVAVLGCGIILIMTRFRRLLAPAAQPPSPDTRLAVALGLSVLFYLGFMMLAVAIEANLSLNSRYAFPPFLALATMLIILAAGVTGRDSRRLRAAQAALVAIGTLVLVVNVARTFERTQQARANGVGYASVTWLQSPTLRAVKALPPGAALLSNGPDVIGYVDRRPGVLIPERLKLRTGREDPERPFSAQLAEARRALARGPAYVVFLDGVDWRFYLASERDLVALLKLRLIRREADGRIYAPLPARNSVGAKEAR